jgi:hypothetical protein
VNGVSLASTSEEKRGSGHHVPIWDQRKDLRNQGLAFYYPRPSVHESVVVVLCRVVGRLGSQEDACVKDVSVRKSPVCEV